MSGLVRAFLFISSQNIHDHLQSRATSVEVQYHFTARDMAIRLRSSKVSEKCLLLVAIYVHLRRLREHRSEQGSRSQRNLLWADMV